MGPHRQILDEPLVEPGLTLLAVTCMPTSPSDHPDRALKRRCAKNAGARIYGMGELRLQNGKKRGLLGCVVGGCVLSLSCLALPLSVGASRLVAR